MFIVTVTYDRPLEEVDKVLGPHRAYLDTLYERGILLASGPQQPRTGGVLIFRGTVTKEELAALLAQDPFTTEGIGQFVITEFTPVKHAAAMADLL